MRTIRALIVDDEPLARARIRRFLGQEPDIEVVGECADGRAALAAIKEYSPDLVLLDIQMPEKDGFQVLEELGVGRLPAVVFVTAYDEYAIKAFDVSALDYLLKPIDRERFGKTIAKVRKQLFEGGSEFFGERLHALIEHIKGGREGELLERVMIKSAGRIVFLRVGDIDWAEVGGNYLVIHAGKERHVLRETMGRLASRLDPNKFMRIHRSTLVNVDRIKELHPLFGGEYEVVLRDGTKLTLSRGYRDRLQVFFEKWS